MKNREHQFRIDDERRLRGFGVLRQDVRGKSLISRPNKRHLRADGLKLLPSALRPRLLESVGGGMVGAVSAVTALAFVLSGLSVTSVSAASITLTIPSSPLSLDIEPNNTFTKSSASTVSVKTDAFAGYTLTIKAKTDNNLINGNNKIVSIANNLSEDQYKATGNSNTWGYQPSKFDSNSNTNFLPGPTTSASTLEKTNAKNDTANNYNIVLGAKADSTLPAGTYSNTFILSATANTVKYSITYNVNGGDSSSLPSPNPQTDETTEQSIKLSETTPTRDGYEFLGWCTTNPETAEECSGKTYDAGADYTLTNGDNTVTLYATWKALYVYNPIPTECQNLGVGEAGSFTDPRDGTTYKIAHLDDHKCWMTENLRITGSSTFQSGHSKVLTSADTDINDDSTFTLPTSNLSKFNVGSSGYYTTKGKNNDAAYVDPTYGGYYTWHTATAGSGTADMTTQNQIAPNSICPKGWRLPTGGAVNTGTGNGDFQNLMDRAGIANSSAGSTKLRGAPYNFTYAGYVHYSGGSLYSQGSGGFYWSSTVNSATGAYLLSFYSSSVSPQDSSGRPAGNSVRCVARE